MSFSSFKRAIMIFLSKIQYGYGKLMPMILKVVSNIGH
jgi:hypothetical protein